MIELNTVLNNHERHRRARARVRRRNKDIVFDALSAEKITEVHVEFDGEGDDGQIREVWAYRGRELTQIPTTTIAIREVSWGVQRSSVTQSSLEEAIETLCYDCLAENHDDWRNDGGSYGEFRFDVGARTVTLEINERYTDVQTSNHTF